ncbi:retrovirus-related pol polyprotein from transposon TNT 1-94 [Tanacetum coccineum]|uniref:Retrovirus-related pol polyprotein from transposon TNT 1-94 n=1 Tax=Tanacetum coccineum TaxID=301880 RepID=A0ABQ5CSF4_9ASTR
MDTELVRESSKKDEAEMAQEISSKRVGTKSWFGTVLSHLNFGTINQLAKQGLVRGLSKLKFEKDHLCSACSLGKSKKHSHKPKYEDTNQEKLYLLHMDLLHVESINGNKYILVIIDDYSWFTWVTFLRSKDEALKLIIKFIKMIQVRLNATVRNIHTDNGIKFVNQTLRSYYKDVSISHETSEACTPQQNDVVERQNQTLVVAPRTMLIYAKAPLFLWAEVVATYCYTQNRSLIRLCHGKTPYELLRDKKPDLSYFMYLVHYVIQLMTMKIWANSKLKLMLVFSLDMLLTISSGPELNEMTHGTLSSGLVPQPPSSTTFVPPKRNDWDTLLQSLFDDYFRPAPCVNHPVLDVTAPEPAVLTGTPSSTSVDQDAPSPRTSQTPLESPSQVTFPVLKKQIMILKLYTWITILMLVLQFQNQVIKNPPLSDPSRLVSTRHQLQIEALFCYFDAFLSVVEPKSYKEALTESCWIEDPLKEELMSLTY